MPGIDFDRLRAEVPMQQVLQLLGFEPNRCRGDQWYGVCLLPRCATSPRPTFSVNVALGRFYCHHQGHQIQLWAAATGLQLHPAACVASSADHANREKAAIASSSK